MISSDSFRAGRIYSVIYSDAVKMVGKRDVADIAPELLAACPKLDVVKGKAINPLAERNVTVRRVSSVQAAGGETWERFKARNGIETNPDSNRVAWYHESAENDCIVVGHSENTNGRKYLRALPTDNLSKEEYYVDSIPATSAELATIRAFKRSSSGAQFLTLPLESLLNVSDVTAFA